MTATSARGVCRGPTHCCWATRPVTDRSTCTNQRCHPITLLIGYKDIYSPTTLKCAQEFVSLTFHSKVQSVMEAWMIFFQKRSSLSEGSLVCLNTNLEWPHYRLPFKSFSVLSLSKFSLTLQQCNHCYARKLTTQKRQRTRKDSAELQILAETFSRLQLPSEDTLTRQNP